MVENSGTVFFERVFSKPDLGLKFEKLEGLNLWVGLF